MGLGPLALCALQHARERALEARRLRHEGIDPIDQQRAPSHGQSLSTA